MDCTGEFDDCLLPQRIIYYKFENYLGSYFTMANAMKHGYYFRSPHLLWFIIIPAGMLLNFITWYNVDWLPLSYMSYLGSLAYYLGTNHPWLMLISNILAFIAHMAEAIYAKRITYSLSLSPMCSAKWYAQTFLIGYPSLKLLLDYSKQMRAY